MTFETLFEEWEPICSSWRGARGCSLELTYEPGIGIVRFFPISKQISLLLLNNLFVLFVQSTIGNIFNTSKHVFYFGKDPYQTITSREPP
jgi:hypothetical protein